MSCENIGQTEIARKTAIIIKRQINYKLKNMADSYWRKSFIWILKANMVLWAINVLSFAVLFALGFNLVNSGYFSKITLLETGITFLVGGALAFSGSALPSKAKDQILKKDHGEWSIENLRSSEKRANKYLILAVILFLECLAASFLGA
jgi:hypothetical protein